MARKGLTTPDNKPRGGGGGGSHSQSSSHSSQKHNTPGSASQDSVTTEAVLARLAKAKDIESTLETLASSKKASGSKLSASDEKMQQALRLQLCEVLSDVILNDPALAHSHDAIGRLWKVCFYGRINDIRTRIVKEKSRARKRHAAGEREQSQQHGSMSESAAKKIASDLERQLKQFLKEAIQLYKYIIERYVKELMPLSQSQTSNMSGDQEHEEERQLVVIASLYRMQIHLGDLHRYSCSYKQAEECYLRSAKLAPGTGNPYNQLAVVAQQSPESMSVLALYYYARSLMATREPFETSRSNLVRLFEANKKWLEEHSREDTTRGIVDVSTPKKAAAMGDKKTQREWIQKERAAMNRKALARIVDLTWAFFRGVSFDEKDDDRVSLDDLKTIMTASEEVLQQLIGQASFSESLLCKLMAILAFSTLGASNGGKLLTADGFYAKRAKHPEWNEGIVVTNQALAFSFFLRLCAVLARDVEAVIAKKVAANNAHKLGAIRSMSPLLLGFQYVASLYEGKCDYFHGLPFFPGSGMAGGDGSSIPGLCKESHVEFWKSLASMANSLDSLPPNKQTSLKGDAGLAELKEFAEFRGYAPFASFLDKPDEDASMASTSSAQHDKKTKYAPADEVIDVLSEENNMGNGKGVEAETRLKISLMLSIVNENTCPGSNNNEDGQYFLMRNAKTNKREFINICTEKETVSTERDMVPDTLISSPDHPLHNITGMEVDNITEMENAAPQKLPSPEVGMALLTPSALLAGVASELPSVPVNANNEANNSVEPSNIRPVASANDVDALLNATLSMKQNQPEPSKKAPLLPPPGFAMQPPPPEQRSPQSTPLAPNTGISLSEFIAPIPPHREKQNVGLGPNLATMTGSMPQAGPSAYSVPSMLKTMNPFAQQPLPPSFHGNFIAPTSPNSFGQPPGLLNQVQGSSVVNPQQQPMNNGLDPTLDFLLSSNNRSQSHDNLLSSSNAFNLMVPQSTAAPEPEDPSESILKFLFEPNIDNATASSQSMGQPLYANQQHSSQTRLGDMLQTKNPFAT